MGDDGKAGEEKLQDKDGGNDILNKDGIAVKCKKGKKPDVPNQDSYSVTILDGGEKLLCVFDGHGPGGHESSEFCSLQIPQIFFDSMKKDADDAHIRECLQKAFVETQKQLTSEAKSNVKLRADDSGTTCTVVYRPPGTLRLYVAHVGDSRAVLRRDKVVENLTEDHKPGNKEEKKRIESKGGRVEWDGYFNHRVYTAEGRGGLNMSRALGDNYVKPAGVTEVPEIRVIDLVETDKYVLLCSDGVWEFIDSEQACEAIKDFGREDAQQAAEKLSLRSYQEWMNDSDEEISDDITVLLYWL